MIGAGETTAKIRRRNVIDPAIAGREVGQVRFPVERSKLVELARSYQDDDPVWYDVEAARAAGFDDIPMPPTLDVLADHWRTGGAAEKVKLIGADLRRILHGEASWEYLAPVHPGDELTARQRVADVTTREGKRGGTMTLVQFETEYTNQHGELVRRRRDTLIETG